MNRRSNAESNATSKTDSKSHAAADRAAATPKAAEAKKTVEINPTALTKQVRAFQAPSRGRSIFQIVNSLVPYVLLFAGAYFAMQVSYWLAVPLIIVAAGFVIRLFIIFHDCGHGSFFKSRRANDTWGVITGILTFFPYHYWRAAHARHHATSANLDKRGVGDVWMMTVEEYKNASKFERLKYRLYRNPLVMFLLGPLFMSLISNRFVRRNARRAERLSVYGTNAAIVALAVGVSLLIGWKAFLLIQLPILFVAQVMGIWLFYVQHQFEGVYWAPQQKWDFVTASLHGGSYYALPKVLNWFTGSIGYHHIHHLNSRIPNYNLAKCHEQVEALQVAPKVNLWTGLKSLSYRLWDERENRLVGFGAVRKGRAA